MSAKPRRLLFVALMLNILALLGAIYAGTREPAQSISIIILVIICLLISIALISTFLRRDHPESTAPTDHKSIVILPNTPIDFTGINGETVRVEPAHRAVRFALHRT